MSDDFILKHYADNAGEIYIKLRELVDAVKKAGGAKEYMRQEKTADIRILSEPQGKCADAIKEELIDQRGEFTRIIIDSPKKKEIESKLDQYHLLKRKTGLFSHRMDLDEALLFAWKRLRKFHDRDTTRSTNLDIVENFEVVEQALRIIFTTAVAAGATTKVPEHRVLVGK